jgi:hypothetical protein
MTNQPGNQNNLPEPPPRSTDWLPRWELFALFLGDLGMMALFGIWGQSAHGLLAGNQEPLRAVVNTAAPFMLGWLLASILVGTYRGTALYPLSRTIWKTALAGLLGGPLGGVFWALSRGHWPVWEFYAVTTGISASMLLVWRVIWSRVRRAWWPELP